MLTTLKKIENLGVFSNYNPANDLPEFQRYNVIYGDNGSGKTTLSRLLASLPAGSHPEYNDLKYSITTQSGAFTHGQNYPRKVRVFNADYVEANVGRGEGPIPHILIVGEGNKALANEIIAEETAVAQRLADIDTATSAITKHELDRGKLFSAIAKTIGEAISGATVRSYRKPDAEAAYAKLMAYKELSEEELAIHRTTVHQEQMDIVSNVILPVEHNIDGTNRDLLEVLVSIAADTNLLTLRTAQSAVIARLEQKPDVSDWVERGIAIHRDHNSERCEFCDQLLTTERMSMLAGHFSDEDQKLKAEIEAQQSYLDVVRHYTRDEFYYKGPDDKYYDRWPNERTTEYQLMSVSFNGKSIMSYDDRINFIRTTATHERISGRRRSGERVFRRWVGRSLYFHLTVWGGIVGASASAALLIRHIIRERRRRREI